jgi:hypothetical protein
MSYFNHAFKKTFVATHDTQADDATHAGVTNGILTQTGVHVSELKNQLSPYQLGPGVVGMFDAKTNLSTDAMSISTDCCPFYLAAAAIKLNDKQGPFHGGYQESNKSKVINPKLIRKVWKVTGNAASRAVIEIGGTLANGNIGAILTFDPGTLVPGATYANAIGVATTGGTGTGLTVDITTAQPAGTVTAVTVNEPGLGYTIGDTITITGGDGNANIKVLTVDADNECLKDFYCGQSYYLRIDVKGTPVLRFANHNLYRTLQADGGCCADPANPTTVDPTVIYLQWATRIAEDPYLKDFVRPILVVDGDSYAYTAEIAVAEGLAPTAIFANAPTTSTSAGIILVGAYYDTIFGDCTFQPNEYYAVEPIQLFASEVDYTGNPCTFETLCVLRRCEGMQAMGLGEQKLRDLILSESYLQNFLATDLRIREITQGTAFTTIIDRATIYSSFFILHSVPRYNNPTGVFDNDQYLLEIIGTSDTVDDLETAFDTYLVDCMNCGEVEDYSGGDCSYDLPVSGGQ